MAGCASPRRPTRVAVELDRGRAAVVDLGGGEFLAPRVLDVRGRSVRVALVGHCATLLAGDRLSLEVRVGPGVDLELVEPSGTVAYNGRGGHADWEAHVSVGSGGSLTWAAAPFVVAGGADVTRDLGLTLADGAVALLRELFVLGRSGEQGGALLSRLRVTAAGGPLLVEALDLREAGCRSRPGVLGANRVVGTAMLLGIPVADPVDEHTTPLAGAGMLARVLAQEAHEAQAVLAAPWERWRQAVSGRAGPG